MSNDRVSRRWVVGALGAGAAAAVAPVASAAVGKRLAHTRGAPASAKEAPLAAAQAEALAKQVAPPSPEQRVADRLVAPLAPGASLASWRVERVEPLAGGAVSVVFSDEAGVQFQVDVCARDGAAAPRGPAQTTYFDLYVANTGDGTTDTVESHGLCAMALAELVRSNESTVDRSGFRTLNDRAAEARRYLG